MIKNINLMQNPNDIAWDKYSEEYIIQALANLGQRMGIKGDGIAYKSFTFNDILNSDDVYDSKDYVGYVEFIKNNVGVFNEVESSKYKANIGIANKNNLTDIINIDTTLNINNTLYFPSELSFTIPINGIEKYSKNSICINENNELTFMLAGKNIGYDDNDDFNTVLFYEKFDTLTNKLKYYVKISHFTSDDNYDRYCLISIKNSSYADNHLTDSYVMDIYLFNDAVITNEQIRNSFKSIFSFKNYNNTDQLPFNLLNPSFIDTDILELYNEDKSFDINSPVSIIINNTTYEKKQVLLKYDTDSNQLLAKYEDDYQSILDLYNNEYKLNLDEEIFFVNEDIIHLYYNIFNYYNEKFYLEDKSSFVKRILVKLYENISEYKYENSYRLYVPLNYKFHYICNSNDEMEIYYSNNIYVSCLSLKGLYLEDFWNNNDNLIYDYNGISKIKAYNFEINYNVLNESIINSVAIKEIYTMPYINANENWSINDVDTKIRATGKDAGNPNIIIVFNIDKENKENNSYEILNAISNKQYIIGSSYELTWFNVNNALFDNIYNDEIKCCAYIPKITSENFEYFKNSIILSISDLNCFEYDDYKYKYKGSYVLTLWHLVENKYDEFEFKCICDPDTNYALSLGASINLLNETNDSSITNLNAQDLILLKAVLSTVGQERLAINNNNWLIIKNKQAEEYSITKDNSNIYNNDLNGIVQYNDTIDVKSNFVIHSQTNKYISDITKLNITNALYPKYSFNTVYTNGKESVVKLQKINSKSVVTKVRESRVSIKGQLVTNIESLIEELNVGTIDVTELKDVIIEEAIKINSNYNEYTFNSNIPTLDLKEVFNRNVNVLNRVNIISLDNNGKIYNAYIGTSYDEASKNTLHIGTSPVNINLGTDTLINEIDKSKFSEHSTVSLDFDNIILNSKNKLIAKRNTIYQYSNNSIEYNMQTINMIGMTMDTDIPANIVLSTQSWNNDSNEIFAKKKIVNISEVTGESYESYEYSICINNVMKSYFSIDISEYKTYVYYKETNDVEYDNTNIVQFERKSMNDIVYLVNMNKDIIVYRLPNNVIYSTALLNVMYYIDTESTNEGNFNAIYIYVSFKK